MVFLAGMEEGLFPHKMSMENLSGLEEERRLCYVGITRAMKKLTITYAESRRLHGEVNLTRPSRFIREIPQELIEQVRLKSTVSRPFGYGNNAAYGRNSSGSTGTMSNNKHVMSGAQVPETEISLGQRVRHGKFGEGVVLNYEGSGPNARVQVNFKEAGSKWLVLSFARLEVVA